MMESDSILLDLLRRYGNNQATEPEVAELLELIKNQQSEKDLAKYIEEVRAEQRAGLLKGHDHRPDWESIWYGILTHTRTGLRPGIVRKFSWKKVAAAAAIIFCSGIAAFLYFSQQKSLHQPAVVTIQDIPAPASSRATVTLANGQRILLDSAKQGLLAEQSQTTLKKLKDGSFAYEKIAKGKYAGKIIYNTIENPRGSSVVNFVMTDGSHVWLNVGSSITYPVSFTGNERRVFITGEAYFEVAPDASKPFFVTKGETSVQVLGTHFNVNSYNDEPAQKITLLEGRVKILSKNNAESQGRSVTLSPNQQAILIANNSAPIQVKNNVNGEEVMAWKNEQFVFNGPTPIDEIMRQISRWYDVDIVYESKIQTMMGGSISRKENLSQLLKMLELAGPVQFTLENRRVIVKPK